MEQYEHESERRGLPLQRVLGDDADRRTALVAIGVTAVVGTVLVVLAVAVGADGPWWFFAALAAVAVLTLVLAIRSAKTWFAWGNPQLFLPSSEDLRLGDRVVVRFRRRARAGLDPTRVEIAATLVCEERVRATDGSLSVERVVERPIEVTIRDLGIGAVEADLTVDIPLFDAAPTMDLASTFEVAWCLEVRLVAAGAPDDDSTFPLVVAPAVSSRLILGGTT